MGCGITGYRNAKLKREFEQFTNEMSQLLCKDLPANPCSRMGVGELCSPLDDHLKRKRL
jgi:hypothetical protein